jgi:hypothetical protein
MSSATLAGETTGGYAAVVVPGHDEHATRGGAAEGVAMLDGVARTVHARALAVPHGVDAGGRARGVGLHALRAQHGGGGQLLVDGRQEADAALGQAAAGAPHGLVHRAQR